MAQCSRTTGWAEYVHAVLQIVAFKCSAFLSIVAVETYLDSIASLMIDILYYVYIVCIYMCDQEIQCELPVITMMGS